MSVVSQAAIFSVLALAQTHFVVLCIDNLSINIHPVQFYHLSTTLLLNLFLCALSRLLRINK